MTFDKQHPRTAAEYASYPQTSNDHFGYRLVRITFAAQLERELAALSSAMPVDKGAERAIELARVHRDDLGREVRRVWIEWAKTQPAPKPSWLVAYDDLNEPDKEVDRMIGERLARVGIESVASPSAPAAAWAKEAAKEIQNGKQVRIINSPMGHHTRIIPLSEAETESIILKHHANPSKE